MRGSARGVPSDRHSYRNCVESNMNDSIKSVSILFPEEGLSTGCEVKMIEEGVYKLLEHPIMAEAAKFGDTIKAEVDSVDQICFIKVLEESNCTMFDWILPKNVLVSPEFANLKEILTENKIYWQQDFGGCFMCFIPNDVDFDIVKEIKQIT